MKKTYIVSIIVNILLLLIITSQYSRDNITTTMLLEDKIRLENEVYALKTENNTFIKDLNGKTLTVDVTMYRPRVQETDSTPNITADLTMFDIRRASNYHYIAVSQDLLTTNGGSLDFGDYVFIRGIRGKEGIYQVRDVMNGRWKNRIDILENVNFAGLYYYDDIEIVQLIHRG